MPVINYIQEHKSFIQYASDEMITANECILWEALFQLMNERATCHVWPDGFIPLPNGKVLSFTVWGSGDSANETLRRARDKLITRGLIDYVPGEKRKKAPMYKMRWFTAVEQQGEASEDEGFTHKKLGNVLGKVLGKPLGKVLGIKEDGKPNPDPSQTNTHSLLSATANGAGARAWFDPEDPEGEDDGAWRQNARARAAVAQRILTWALDRQRLMPNGEDTHTMLCDLMAAGMAPGELVELAGGCRSIDQWEQRLLQRAHLAGLDLGEMRSDLYALRRTRGLHAQGAVITLREREKRQERMG